jgi:hypothetical protein
MMNDDILMLSEKLLKINRRLLNIYLETREKGINHDFQEVIKPFANEVKEVNEEWNVKTKKWLGEKNFKHLHVKQADTTTDHLNQISIQAFFSETSRSRFLNANRTVEYFLLELIKELEK